MRKMIVTFFGAGLSPVAPGTAGSLAISLVLYAITFAHPSYLQWQMTLMVGFLVSSAATVRLGPWAIAHFGRKDPQAVVLDEVAGICLTNLLLPTTNYPLSIAIAFVAFRVFDVTKPPPVRKLELLPGGWGILLDDVCAAVFGNAACRVAWWVHHF